MWSPPDPKISTCEHQISEKEYSRNHDDVKKENGTKVTLLGFSGTLGSAPTFRLLKIQSLVQERSQWKWMKEMIIKGMMIKSDNVKAIQRRYTCRHNIFGGSSE